MRTDIFEPMVVAWSPQLKWTQSELNRATKILAKISIANGGQTAPDTEATEEVLSAFAIQRAEDALSKKILPYSRALTENLTTPNYKEPSKKHDGYAMPDLIPYQWKQCVDLNSSDVDTIQSLPGIGRSTALQIIQFRNERGGIDKLEQLVEIRGIGDRAIESLKDKVYCGTTPHVSFMTKELSDFITRPTFKGFVALIVETKGSFAWTTNKNNEPKRQIFSELKKALNEVKANPFGVAKNLGFTRVSNVLREQRKREIAQSINEKAVNTIKGGALLYDGQYLPFLRKLIEQAKESITVMMFFLKYDNEKDYISNSLIEGLIKAHKNGLTVKVILDKDAEGDVIGSRFINEPVFQALTKNGVPVLYDREDRMTHSKLVVVDRKHVVVGSHNWTGGSFLSYDDTSLYIESSELGQKYEGIFNAFWDEYSPTSTSPNPARVKCIEEGKTGRNLRFQDQQTKKIMSAKEFCNAIETGSYPEYHVRIIKSVKVPVSNPNFNTNDNLE